MTTYKIAAQCVSVLFVFSSFQAQADDAICNNANAVIHKLKDKALVYDSMMGVSPTYQATLADGFLYGDDSGLLFNENKIVSWGKGDALVIHPQESPEQKAKGEKNPLKFFIQHDEVPYNGPNDKGTKGGIYKVEAKDLKSNKKDISCSKEDSAYAKHFFPAGDKSGPALGDVYCVRTRSGNGYALIKVANICTNGLVFNYKYNGASNVFNNERQLAPGERLTIQELSISVPHMLGRK